ncbi:MAG: AAA family ATPase [Candidatus Paceibacteria bacterium]
MEINGFKSIAESGEVNLHDNITTLVGPNEAGKTGFLEAIEFFSHEKEITDEQICDYDSSLDADGKPVVEINASGVNPSNFSTGFGNINEISEVEGSISITIKKYSNGDYEVTSSDIDRELQRYKSTRSDRIEAAIGNLESIINQIEENLEESVENYSEIKRIINSIRSSGRITGRAQSIPRITTLLEELMQELRFDSDLETRQLMFRISESVDKLESLRPAAQIFVNEIFNIYIRKEFSLIGDGKDIGEIDYSDNSDPYSNLLQYIGEPPEEIRNMDTRSRRKLISERMADFSEQFSDVWGQENIEFDLDLVNNSI